jgi:hypothetical protein
MAKHEARAVSNHPAPPQVTNMSHMFELASSFNSDLKWNTAKVHCRRNDGETRSKSSL